MKDILDFVLHDQEIRSYVQGRKIAFLESELGYELPDGDHDLNVRILRIEYLLLNKLLMSVGQDINPDLYDIAYSILMSYDIDSKYFENLFNEMFGVSGIDNYSLYYFYIASLGLKSDKTVQVRLDLRRFKSKNYDSIGDWQSIVVSKILESFLFFYYW
jgi:hypothetical protein